MEAAARNLRNAMEQMRTTADSAMPKAGAQKEKSRNLALLFDLLYGFIALIFYW